MIATCNNILRSTDNGAVVPPEHTRAFSIKVIMRIAAHTLMRVAVIALILVGSMNVSLADETDGATPLAVNVVLSTNTTHIGDPFRATISIKHPIDSTIDLPEIGRDKELIIRNEEMVIDQLSEQQMLTTFTYDMVSFRIGTHILSTGEVNCVIGANETITESFPFKTITIETSLIDENTPMQDIKGPVDWPAQISPWLWILPLLALFAIICAIVTKKLLGRRQHVSAPAPPPRPADEVAMAALKLLQSKGWIESENIEPFYVELSNIARLYLENRFHLRAPEQTTEEFIRTAATSQLLSLQHQGLIRDFLEQSDLVKFARYRPNQKNMREAFESTTNLVHETSQRPAENPEHEKEQP